VLQSLFHMINDGTLVNSMNKSSLPSPSAQSTLLLRSLQEIIHNRIIQKKREMHPSHNKAYLESLWTEIETLQWVSAQSLSVRRRLLDGQPEEKKQNKTFAGLKYTY
jgi:hypothetical protein